MGKKTEEDDGREQNPQEEPAEGEEGKELKDWRKLEQKRHLSAYWKIIYDAANRGTLEPAERVVLGTSKKAIGKAAGFDSGGTFDAAARYLQGLGVLEPENRLHICRELIERDYMIETHNLRLEIEPPRAIALSNRKDDERDEFFETMDSIHEEMKEACEALKDAWGAGDEELLFEKEQWLYDLDTLWHMTICDGSDIPATAWVVKMLRSQARVMYSYPTDEENLGELVRHHEDIREALKDRAQTRIREAFEWHLDKDKGMLRKAATVPKKVYRRQRY